MEREEALALVRKEIRNENLIKHMLAVEAVMRALAHHLGEDEKLWSLAGLLHDIDYEKTKDNPAMHTVVAKEMLAEYGLPDAVIRTIQAHNEIVEPQTVMETAIICADDITGMIVTTTLVRPSKKIVDVKVKSVKKKMKDKSFAAGVDRSRIMLCEEIGIPLAEFISMSLEAMKGIAEEIGL